MRECRNEYQRSGGRDRSDRIVRCSLPAGHDGDHEETDTEWTWPAGGKSGVVTSRRDPRPGAVAELVRQFGEVAKALGHLVRVYPHEIVRGGLRGAMRVEQFFLRAQALGVAQPDARALLDETRRELAGSPFWFDAADEATRRLMEVYVALMPLPAVGVRREARDRLVAALDEFTLADVDRLARTIERDTHRG